MGEPDRPNFIFRLARLSKPNMISKQRKRTLISHQLSFSKATNAIETVRYSNDQSMTSPGTTMIPYREAVYSLLKELSITGMWLTVCSYHGSSTVRKHVPRFHRDRGHNRMQDTHVWEIEPSLSSTHARPDPAEEMRSGKRYSTRHKHKPQTQAMWTPAASLDHPLYNRRICHGDITE